MRASSLTPPKTSGEAFPRADGGRLVSPLLVGVLLIALAGSAHAQRLKLPVEGAPPASTGTNAPTAPVAQPAKPVKEKDAPKAPKATATNTPPVPVAAGETGDIINIVRAWYNAGLLLDMAEMGRLSDSQHAARLKIANSSEQAMLQLRELPDYQELARQLQSKFRELTTFGTPRIDKDGQHASVSFRFNPDGARQWVEMTETATSFIAQAYRAKKMGRKIPSLAEVRSEVIAPESNLAGSIEAKAAAIRNQSGDQPMRLVKERDGWKVDVTRMKAEPPPAPAAPRLAPPVNRGPTIP